MKMENKCAVCKQKASSKCSKCCIVFYCSKDHQKDDWKTHKNICKPVLVSCIYIKIKIKLIITRMFWNIIETINDSLKKYFQYKHK